MSGIELWGGVECTVNRVGDVFHDQLSRNGHDRRYDDLERFAALGIQKLRMPVLWERVAPGGTCDFSGVDEHLRRARALGIAPIVGLVHHGSGPAFTNLLDPAFPEKLAAYARQVAERYPWVEWWTPVNEPLTTARFSGLYGHWYPHGRDSRTCFRALFNQCRAVAAAMRAIREVIPHAKLVQTEDLGHTFSTPKLAYQARYENERRWLSLDLLFGRMTQEHPLHRHLLEHGLTADELASFADRAGAPDIVGLNYYVTSDRYLDERVARFPAWTHGGNGREAYADVEAVRVCDVGIVGHEQVLRAGWTRYGAPVALTEVHLGCTREEQMRWLAEAWHGAQRAKDNGADVRAVTLWSLLGAFDWCSLLTRADNRYESGVFDARSTPPRATAIAHLAQTLAAGEPAAHPALDTPGWWRRADRVVHRVSDSPHDVAPGFGAPRGPVRPILIAGSGGLGRSLSHACDVRSLAHRMMPRNLLDPADKKAVIAALDALRPWAVIDACAGGPTRDAREAERLHRASTRGAIVLAEACAARGIPFVTFSTEHVFDGAKGTAYDERDETNPLSSFGRIKADAEARVRAAAEHALVIRPGTMFGPWSRNDVIRSAVKRLTSGRALFTDESVVFTPTYSLDLAHAALDLLLDGEHGVWHLANVGEVSWLTLAREVATMAGLDGTRLVGVTDDVSMNTALTSHRGIVMPSLGDALRRYFDEHAFGDVERSVA